MEETVFYDEEVKAGDKAEKPKVDLKIKVCKPDILFTAMWKDNILPVVSKLSDQSSGCFSAYEVTLAIQSGGSVLLLGTVNDLFAGFTVIELGGARMGQTAADGPSLWITYFCDRYRGTNAVYDGAKFVEDLALKSLGAKAIYTICYDDDLSALFKKIGFVEIQKLTYFRKELISSER